MKCTFFEIVCFFGGGCGGGCWCEPWLVVMDIVRTRRSTHLDRHSPSHRVLEFPLREGHTCDDKCFVCVCFRAASSAWINVCVDCVWTNSAKVIAIWCVVVERLLRILNVAELGQECCDGNKCAVN